MLSETFNLLHILFYFYPKYLLYRKDTALKQVLGDKHKVQYFNNFSMTILKRG